MTHMTCRYHPLHSSLLSLFPGLFFSALVFLVLSFPVLVQGQIITDVYQLEEDGYLRMPKETPHGIIATNNYASEIYLIDGRSKQSLVAAPGAGMYQTLSPDRGQVGFKHIDDEGLQAPAVLDLATGEVERLHGYVRSAGQPSFFGQRGYAFTIDRTLKVYRDGTEPPVEFDLGFYANIAPVSPDGQHVVYNDDHDRLRIMDLAEGSTRKISEPDFAAYAPVWSPDSRKIAYMTNGGKLFVYSLESGRNYGLGQGQHPSWYGDSEQLVFTRSDIEGFELKSMHIVRSRLDGSGQENLTDPENMAARDASVSEDGDVLYFDALDNAIMRIEKKSRQRMPIYEQDSGDGGGPFFKTAPVIDPVAEPDEAPSAQDLNASVLITDVPFVNQVWDTPYFPGNNYNYAACAPSTAAMAIGYFRKVPPWPSSRYQGITRDYAKYVALEYSAFSYTYDTVSRGVKGGMGFMWSSEFGHSGSPRSTMARYINQHDLESVQVWSLPYADMVKELEDGNPYPLCVMLTSAGHLILALGVEEGRRTVIVHDPYGNKNIAYPSYQGQNVVYDWPGYNYGNQNLETVAWAVSARGVMPAVEYHIPQGEYDAGFASLSEGFDWINTQEELENSIRFVITDDLDERGEDLVLNHEFSRMTPLTITAATGIEPQVTIDRPFVIGSPYVTLDGDNGSEEPGMTIHYTGEALHYLDFEDGQGPVEMPVIAVLAGANEVGLKNLFITREASAAHVPVAVGLGHGAYSEGPLEMTLHNTRVGTQDVPFYAGFHVEGPAASGDLTITDNTIHATHSALMFSSSVFKATVSGNRLFSSADAELVSGDGGDEPVAVSAESTEQGVPAAIRGDGAFSAVALQGNGLEVRDNQLQIRVSVNEEATTDGMRLSRVGGDILMANNMVNVISPEAGLHEGKRVTGIRLDAAPDAGSGDEAASGTPPEDAVVRLYHNTVRLQDLAVVGASAALHATGLTDTRAVELDVRNNIWVSEHVQAVGKTTGSGFDGGSSRVAGDGTDGTGAPCDAAGPLGLCLDSDLVWYARANNWFTAESAMKGWINGQEAGDASALQQLTGDDWLSVAAVHFVSDEELFLDEASRGDVALTGRGVPDVVPFDILGRERHPVFPYMGAHEPEPTLAPTLVGDYHIPQSDHAKGYESLGEAFADLNANGAEGSFRFIIHEDLDETGSPLRLAREDLINSTQLTLLPGAPDVTIRIAHPVMIEHTSYVTIDGGSDRNLRFHMEDEEALQAIWIMGDSRHVTLRNLDITHGFGTQSATVGVQVRRDDDATAAPEYITLERLQIGTTENPFRDGIRLWGTGNPLLRVRAIVTTTEIVATHRGITTFYVNSNTYQNNVIEVTGHHPDPAWYAGIYLAGARGTSVRANQIRMTGINASSPRYVSGININRNEGQHTLVNNMIGVTDDFQSRGTSKASRMYGIAVHREGDGERYNMLHNTIYLGNTTQTGRSAAIGWEDVTAGEDPADYFIINNLLSNRHDRTNAYAWVWHTGVMRHVNNNNLDVTGDAAIGRFEGDPAVEMTRWCELSDADHDSRTVAVHYLSDRDLRLAPESEGENRLAGQYLPAVPTDIFGNERYIDAPYKGAWESVEYALTDVEEDGILSDVPRDFSLQQNYPNPFNPVTQIRYDLPRDSDVRMEVYDLVGRRVAVLVNERQQAGSHQVSFEASNLASGIYVYRIRAGSFVKTHKMTLLK